MDVTVTVRDWGCSVMRAMGSRTRELDALADAVGNLLHYGDTPIPVRVRDRDWERAVDSLYAGEDEDGYVVVNVSNDGAVDWEPAWAPQAV